MQAFSEEKSKREKTTLQVALYKTASDDSFILVNNLENTYFFPLELNESIHRWEDSYEYFTKENGWEGASLKRKLFPELTIYEYLLKLPEKGTTILAVKDSAQTLADSEAFWQDKITNHPDKIVYLDWDAKKGIFQIRPTALGK